MANVFREAVSAYEDSINDLRMITKSFEKYSRENGGNYNARYTLNQFDILLQYSLLQMALADGFLHENEVFFIKEITQYADLCDYLEDCGYDDVTWKKIYNTRESTLNRILDDVQDDVMRISKDFVVLFTVFDAATDYDYLKDLINNISKIAYALCAADGNAEKIELNNGCLIIDVLAEITVKKEQLKKHL